MKISILPPPKPAFQPVTITLETQEEVNIMCELTGSVSHVQHGVVRALTTPLFHELDGIRTTPCGHYFDGSSIKCTK